MRNIQILSSLKFYALSDQIVYFFESDFGGERGLFVPGSYRHGTGLPSRGRRLINITVSKYHCINPIGYRISFFLS